MYTVCLHVGELELEFVEAIKTCGFKRLLFWGVADVGTLSLLVFFAPEARTCLKGGRLPH